MREHITKNALVKGRYYYGHCRNAYIARFDGEKFIHRRHKFGQTFLEEIQCPEDNSMYDVFYAQHELHAADVNEIPIS